VIFLRAIAIHRATWM